MLDPRLEQHLVADADRQRRAPAGSTGGYDFRAANGNETRHACRKRTYAGYDQAVGIGREPHIGADGDICARTGDRSLGRADIA
jgi:hypothetical protein